MQPRTPRPDPARRIVFAVLLLLVVCAGIALAHLWPDEVTAVATEAAHFERSAGVTGWLLAALVQLLIAMSGILPASVGALTAGMMFGVTDGFLLSGAATLVGAVLAFLASRSLFRPLISGSLARRPRIRRLDEAIAHDGWRLVVLLRISPIMPFAVTSYALGLTSLGLRDYVLGTIASLPALFGYVVLGSLAGAGLTSFAAGEAQPWHYGLLALAIGATALLTLRLTRIARLVMRLPDAPVASP